MCQAYEAEQASIFFHDKCVRSRGWNAQKEGVPREDNPEPDHPLPEYSDKRMWWQGWDTAERGEEKW